MRITKKTFVLLAALLLGANLQPMDSVLGASSGSSSDISGDPYLWLEDVTGTKALDWVRQQNAIGTRALEAAPEFEPLRKRLLAIYDSKDKIPYVEKHGKFYYNFWRDDKNVRGLWRRTTLEEYKKPQPAWETVLDLDKLAEQEKENWVFHGAHVLKPDYDRCLISLSRGGADATVVREFDLNSKAFVKDGFALPEAKSDISWRNRDSIYVGTNFGPDSMTDSGYPRIAKEWQRGTPLDKARTVYEGKKTDVATGASADLDHGRLYEFVTRGITFFSDETLVRQGEQFVKVDKPDDATFSAFNNIASLSLRSDWKVGDKTYPSGSTLVEDYDSYLKGKRDLAVLFQPTERKSLQGMTSTNKYVILTELDNVRSHPYELRLEKGQWIRTAMEAPEFASVSVDAIDADESDDYFMNVHDFLTPSTLYLGTAGKPERVKLKSEPAFFNTDGLEIKQLEAKSKDGTLIPYFLVGRKGMNLDGSNPTLLTGYGGFEIANTPYYDAGVGAAWLERGGVFVLANIRGGGEFGPKWHKAAQKEKRQNAYDDFIAVAQDLIARKVTSPKHLGIKGASNGGLLMGVMLTQRPDLFGAIVCGSPLLDMRRYNHLLAGSSWMDEYGDPDKPADWEFISKYSPYQNVRKDKTYPPVLMLSSTRDDRVHPGHARKMVARLEEQGHPVLYYENIEGGHSAASNNKEVAYKAALTYVFLWQKLK